MGGGGVRWLDWTAEAAGAEELSLQPLKHAALSRGPMPHTGFAPPKSMSRFNWNTSYEA
jgi:hypothetical protein